MVYRRHVSSRRRSLSDCLPAAWAPHYLARLVPAVLLSCWSAGTSMADEADNYNQHVVFENSAADGGHFHSAATVISPSELEVAGGKVPVDAGRFVSPPNALRLKWKSAPGGDWRVTVKVATRYGRQFEFAGDTLSLWCYCDDELALDAAPRIGLQDTKGNAVPDIPLLALHGRLPAGRWVELRLPLARFAGPFLGTDDFHFDIRHLASVTLVQGLDDNQPHTLHVDDIRIVESDSADDDQPAEPQGLTAVGQDRHVDLTWQPGSESDLLSYRIDRSWDGEVFVPIGTRPSWSNRYVDFIGEAGKRAHYRIRAVDVHQNESPASAVATAETRAFNDEQLLDMVQEGCFRYYWEMANPNSGMAVEILPGDENLVAVGASGFGIMAMLVAAEREFITREECLARLLQIVRFLERADRFHGVWPHFLDGRTGRVNTYFGKYDNGGDLVETAFLIQGLLAARQYFNRDTHDEREIRERVTALWRAVEWDWHRKTPDSEFLYWHWSPDHAWHISHPLVGWNETLIVYLLAIASPTHGVPASLYHTGWAGQSDMAVQYRRNWSRTTQGDHFVNGNEYYGVKLDVGSGNGGELFFTQFSFLCFDPRAKRDAYTNYFTNNRAIALIHRAYSIENPRGHIGYGPDCWGRSAGINSGGGRPLPRDDNGTICTSAALGSFPYTPNESLAALKHFYRRLGSRIWGAYGFHDGFNQTENWFDEVYMGLNQAQIVVGIENQRTGLVWQNFMANPEIEPALKAIGFQSDAGEK